MPGPSERPFIQPHDQWPETAGVEMDRKMLADLAIFDKQAFSVLAEQAKANLSS